MTVFTVIFFFCGNVCFLKKFCLYKLYLVNTAHKRPETLLQYEDQQASLPHKLWVGFQLKTKSINLILNSLILATGFLKKHSSLLKTGHFVWQPLWKANLNDMSNWWLSFNEYLIQNVAADNWGHFTKNTVSHDIGHC